MQRDMAQAATEHDFPASGWSRIGMLTPSSNTVLEPCTSAMLAGLDGRATCHFARFRVTEISMSQSSQTQFESGPILQATRDLAEAGFETDEQLCRAITAETGIAATSSILALNEILSLRKVRRLGLVTPYLGEIQERIIANYAAAGIDIVADRRLGDRGNFSFAEYSPQLIAEMVRGVAASEPDAIAIVCTNFRGAPIVAALEEELGIIILDSVSLPVWATMRLCGLDPKSIRGWGRLFQEVA